MGKLMWCSFCKTTKNKDGTLVTWNKCTECARKEKKERYWTNPVLAREKMRIRRKRVAEKKKYLIPFIESIRRQKRFWRKVDIKSVNECWGWTAFRDKDGYGKFNLIPKKGMAAHRASWILTYGEIPSGLVVRHICDNPPCVNPTHLKLGTQKDNKADSISKGRHIHGERFWGAKLTLDKVKEIRRRYKKVYGQQAQLAKEFGVGSSTISSIVNNQNWK